LFVEQINQKVRIPENNILLNVLKERNISTNLVINSILSTTPLIK